MKATGIVRRIDDLGRVVIPKEIRRTMRIREGDPLEIFTDVEGEVVFKKYSPVGEMVPFAAQYADVLSRACGMTVLICDRDRIVTAAGSGKKDLTDRRLSASLERVMEARQTVIGRLPDGHPVCPAEESDHAAAITVPILSAGDVIGAVCFLQGDGNTAPSEGDVRLAQVAAAFLGKQMEE